MSSDWHRCFIALVPDAAGREALAAVPVGASVRRVPVDQLHMTLAFLGSIPEGKGRLIAAALPSLVAPLPALPAGGIECWPSAVRPRLVVRALAPTRELAALAARVRARVTALGLPIDDHRPFRPHITLARLSRGAGPLGPIQLDAPRSAGAGGAHPRSGGSEPGGDDAGGSPLGDVAGDLNLRFEALTLYSSTLERRGARYRALASVLVTEAD